MQQHDPTPVVTASFAGVLTVENSSDLVPVAPYDSLRKLSDEQERALIERARSGDQAARDEMFLWLLSPVKRYATRYYLAYYWEAPGRVSPDDLVSEAMVRMLERFATALAASNPFAYLLSVAYGAIRKAMSLERSPIRTPYTPGERPLRVKSLDAPPIYEAAARLSERERAVIAEWYGVYETAPASMEAILAQIGRAGMGSYKTSALAKLYRLLAPVYPQYCGGGYVQELRKPGGQVKLSDSHKIRLDAAYAQLQESGQQITVHALGQAAGINTVYASNYLYQQGYMPPSKQQRLDAAYAQLQERGQKITARRLAHTAQISNTHASLYLQQRGQGAPYYQRVQPTEDRAVRVADAYAQLQESGQPITRRTLGAAAHVGWQYAAAYIQQQQGSCSAPRFGGKRDAQEREVRLSRAYEQLQHSTRPLSAEALCKAAHVRRQSAAAYLHQRQQASNGGDAA
jgi:DNA-directed RNA polymerase specialized sigma24 family protein